MENLQGKGTNKINGGAGTGGTSGAGGTGGIGGGTKPTRPKPTRPNNNGAPNRPPKKPQAQQTYTEPDTPQEALDDFDDFNYGLVNDTVQQNKNKGKKKEKVKEKKEVTPEQKKKLKIISISIGIAVVAVVVIAVVLKAVSVSNSKHIVVENNTTEPTTASEVHENQNETEGTNSDTGETEVEAEAGSEIESEASSQFTVPDAVAIIPGANPTMSSDKYGCINTIVNTKTADDKAFTDHETKLYVGLSGTTVGYDETSQVILQYNSGNSENKVIQLPTKDDYYLQSNGTELVSYTVEVLFPEDYPTNGSEGYIYKFPEVSMTLKGTTKEIDNDDLEESPDKYIVVGDMIYGISKITELKDVPERISVGNKLEYKFITSVPANADKSNYEIEVHVVIDGETYSLSYEGVTIPSSGYVVPLDTSKSGADETGESTSEVESESSSEADEVLTETVETEQS